MRRLSVGVVGALLAAILFFPADLYKLPSPLPIDLDPYRSVLAALLLVWLFSIFLVHDFRFRGTAVDGALLLFVIAVVASLVFNVAWMDYFQFGISLGRVALMIVWVLTFYVVLGLVTRRVDAERLIRVTVIVTTFLAFMGIVERFTGYPYFRHLHEVMPFLQPTVTARVLLEQFVREGGLRVSGSATHPIAFATMMGLVLPYGVQLCFDSENGVGRFGWGASALLIMLGMFATGSRTALVALFAGMILVVVSRPRQRAVMAGAGVGALFALHMLLPGSIRGLLKILSPEFIIATDAGNIEGRLEDYPKIIDAWRRTPLFGQGLGTHPIKATVITDNQYLKLLAETGALGALALAVLAIAVAVALYRAGRSIEGPHGPLVVAGACASLVFGTTAFTFDIFGFEQVTFLFIILIALSFAIAKESAEVSQDLTRSRGAAPPSSVTLRSPRVEDDSRPSLQTGLAPRTRSRNDGAAA